jgi:PhzF family phenazine biosynthesis protein
MMQKNRRLSVPIYQVDAFAGKAFSGNPAAVCWLENEIDELLMQSIAAEMNLSETAFVYSVNDGFNLRWFTPTIEVDLCGHATLAAAHILWEQGKLPMDEIASFHTRSGILLAKYSQDGIVLDFPSVPAIKCDVPDGLLQALGVSVKGDKVWRCYLTRVIIWCAWMMKISSTRCDLILQHWQQLKHVA